MIPVLLIAIPLVTGLSGFLIKSEAGARAWALVSALVSLLITLVGLGGASSSPMGHTSVAWLADLGSRFAVGFDGLSKITVLLPTLSFPLIFIATWRDSYK